MAGIDYAVIYAVTALGFFCMGYAICFLQIRSNLRIRFKKQPNQIKTTGKELTTQCFKCKKTYKFIKNEKGKTNVECPYCHSRAVIA